MLEYKEREVNDVEEGVPLLNKEEVTEDNQNVQMQSQQPSAGTIGPLRQVEPNRNSTRKPIRYYILCLFLTLNAIFFCLTLHKLIYQIIALKSTHTSSQNNNNNGTFEEILQIESDLARELLLKNIGPKAGAVDGLVIASPSRGERPDLPDYYYTWTRDSALVHKSLLPSFLSSPYLHPYEWTGNTSHPENITTKVKSSSQFKLHENLIRAYIQSQIVIQNTKNPSGGLYGGGLNEPKFNVDGSPFTRDWGRPQRDGPALRALTTIPYAHFLLDRGYPLDHKYVKNHLYDPDSLISPGKLIKNDLEKVSHGWWKPGFDLWEEVDGHHFFTLMASIRALQAGAILAYRLNDTGAIDFYAQQAEAIREKLKGFWSPVDRYHFSTVSTLDYTNSSDGYNHHPPALPGRKWLDCSLPLSLIHLGDNGNPKTRQYPNISVPSFGATDPEVISTLFWYINSFSGSYKINPERKPWTEGWALGRYREDVYDGVGKSIANPWHICTNAIAESFYLMHQQFHQQGYIECSHVTQPFWIHLKRETVKSGTRWEIGDKNFTIALNLLRGVGDSFLNVSRRATEMGGGRMSEQIGKDDWKPKGARDLTWSYASFMTAIRARQKAVSMLGSTLKESLSSD